MGDTSLARLVMFLGIAVLLILVTSGSSPPGWSALQDTISAGPGVTFVNPFSSRTFTFHVIANGTLAVGPDGADPEETVDNDAVANCATTATPTVWFGCVQQRDEAVSYAKVTVADRYFAVKLEGFPDTTRSWRVLTVEFNAECHREGASPDNIVFGLYKADLTPLIATDSSAFESDRHPCAFSASYATPAGWSNISTSGDLTLVGFSAADMSAGELLINVDGDVSTAFSYLEVVITYQADFNCSFQTSGNPFDDVVRATYYIGCVAQAIGSFIVDVTNLLLNAVVFLGSLLFYFGTAAVQFFTGLIEVFGWLLGVVPASPLYNAPPVIKLIVAIPVFGAMFYLFIEGIRILAEIVGALIP